MYIYVESNLSGTGIMGSGIVGLNTARADMSGLGIARAANIAGSGISE